MAQSHAAHKHPWHLVDPSPWPALGAFGALVLAIGAIIFMHGGTWLILAAGGLIVLYTMYVWWRDVVREAEHDGYHTRVVQISHRYGMILFIASEVMFFVAWFWAYFNTALFPADPHQFLRGELIGNVWPPAPSPDHVSFRGTFDPWHLPLLNTLILLTSGTTVTWAHHALLHGDRKGLINGLWLTIILGALFT